MMREKIMRHLGCVALFGILGAAGMACAQDAPVFTPAGEAAERINLLHHRFDKVTEPAFTDEFILADVNLNAERPRRFDEFSGDVSGRFIGALSLMSRGAEDDARLRRLVTELITHQHPDGRFGKASLSFAAADVGPDQMALLWGNGRLLVGLMEYWGRFRDQESLASATRLGDFLLRVFDDCAKPEVIERLRGKAANGFICFTQFNEGLELLTRATGDEKYRDTAVKMEALMEQPGDQHTHGYLTTLRGHMMIYEAEGGKKLLEAVTARYDNLFDTGAVKVNGGLMEFFKENYDRDEGCSEADFVRLALQMWRATGGARYLGDAETCLVNSFSGCQHDTGDFGHRAYDGRGYVAVPGPGRSWWCCSMHGMRAWRDVLDCAVTAPEDGGAKINLFLDGKWAYGPMALSLKRDPSGVGQFVFRVAVDKAPGEARPIAVRVPAWAEAMTLKLNGKPVEAAEEGGYMTVNRAWKAGDLLEAEVRCAVRLRPRDGKTLALADLGGEPVEAAVFVGPWLMGVDAALDPMFHGEPFARNTLLLPDTLDKAEAGPEASQDGVVRPLAVPGMHWSVAYKHEGFPDLCRVVLRPIAEQTAHAQTTVSYWHLVKKAE